MDKSVIRYVKEFQAGNEQAFNDLYQAIYDDVFRMACSAVHNQADASDVTQEVFIAIYDNIHLLKDAEAFPLWVQRIVFTRCTRLFRKRKDSLMNENHLRTLAYETEKEKDFLPKEKFDDEWEQELMREMVSRLKPKHQEVVKCVYFQQMSLKETARYLQLPEGTVKSQLYTARNELYGYIKDYERKNQRKINFYDWGTPVAMGAFSWSYLREHGHLMKASMQVWQKLMAVSSVAVTMTCVGLGVNIYRFDQANQEPVTEITDQPQSLYKSEPQIVMGKSIDTPQDAYFTLVDWGVTPDIAKAKDQAEIKEMRKLKVILENDGGIYWQRFVDEGWDEIFEVK